MKVKGNLDFEQAGKIIGALLDPRSSDPSSPVESQVWFNTTSKEVKGYDGTNVFSLLRNNLAATITALMTFNPTGQTVPFALDSAKTDMVQYFNADRVDGYHAAEAANASTLAARDASGNLTVATPTSDGHAATKAYVDSIAAGQDWKDSCRAATTAALPSYTHSSGVLTASANGALADQDGVTMVADNRLLVKNESGANEKYNGLYKVTDPGGVSSPWVLTRTSDADDNAEVTSGLTTFIEEGTENGGSGFTMTTSGAITVGTTALTFSKSSGGSVYTNGNGIVKSGTTFHFGQAASYTVGALPYASGASTIGFISAVASGKVLKSNGENAGPIWAAVDLTADVTGTLPVGKGGTGTADQFTQGSVIFAGASGVYSQDASYFAWDATNHRLGVGGSADSTYRLRVHGGLRLGPGSGNVAINIDGWDSLKWDNTNVLNFGGITGSQFQTLKLFTAGTSQVSIDASGNVTISTLASSSSNSVVTETSGVLQKRTINSGVWGTQTAGRLLVSNGSGVITTDSGLIYDPGTGRTAFSRSAGVYSDAAVTITMKDLAVDANVTSTEMALYLEAGTGYNIATGVTDSGARAGLYLTGNVADTDFEGTLATQYGIYVSHGHTASAVGSIITNSYGLFIDEKTSGSSTVTNSWGIYQTGTNAKNYFAGDVGVGVSPGTKFHVKGANNLNVAVFDATGTAPNYILDLRDDGTSIFRVTGNHRVGVGTVASSPAYPMHLADDTEFDLAIETNNNGASNFAGFRLFKSRGTNASKTTVSNGDLISQFIFNPYVTTTGYIATASIRALVNGTVTGTAAPTDLVFFTGSTAVQVEALRIKSNGDLTVTSTTLVDNLNADTVDGYEASALLDLANSAGDTDDISEGLTNLFYTNARARAALSSAASTEIDYNSSTGVIGLGTEAGRVKSGTIGDGVSTSLTFTHNLNTRDVLVQVHRTATPYDVILVDIAKTSTTQVTISGFGTAPTSGEYTVVCTAANG